MDNDAFKKLLQDADLNKKSFARLIGKKERTVQAWGRQNDVPSWTESWLKMYITLKKQEDYKALMRDLSLEDDSGH